MRKIGLIISLFIVLLICGNVFGQDLTDCVMLFNSTDEQNSDVNFRKLAQFYGLKCREVDLSKTTLTYNHLKDEDGNYLKAVYINSNPVETLLNYSEIYILQYAVWYKNTNILIGGMNNHPDLKKLSKIRYITNYAVKKAKRLHKNTDFIFTADTSGFSQEFSSRTVSFDGKHAVYSFEITSSANPLLYTLEDNKRLKPVLVSVPVGTGEIFIDGCYQTNNLDDDLMKDLYKREYFGSLVPTMLFLKYSLGEECWHSNQKYANFTVDDPHLVEQFRNLNFQDLLSAMNTHDFHTTIAFIPSRFDYVQDQSVIDIFSNNPDRFSLAQHGNNHDGYEFVCYTQDQLDQLIGIDPGWSMQTPRTLAEQEADIVEGKTRMSEFKRTSGLPWGDLMVFPWGISLSPTLEKLKAYNFNMTINSQPEPYLLMEGDNNTYDYYNVRPANTKFGNFPVYFRENANSTFDEIDNSLIFMAFIGKPLSIYTHEDFFKDGMNRFNAYADSINTIFPGIQWASLDQIAKKSYLQKSNDDGSVSVEFYGNNVIISNESNNTKLYHLEKEEWENVPVLDVKIDGSPVSYQIVDNLMQIDVEIPANSSKEVYIRYSSGNKDFFIDNDGISYDSTNNSITVKVQNSGSDSGPVPFQVFDGSPENGKSLGIFTIESVEAGGEGQKEFTMLELSLSSGIHNIHIKLDPANIIFETNEDNNTAGTTVTLPSYDIIDNFEYEDSPLDNNWFIFDGTGQIQTIFDETLGSRVMQVESDNGTGFRIDYPGEHNLELYKNNLSFKMKTGQNFYFYVNVRANNGQDYYIQYTPENGEISFQEDKYIFVPVGSAIMDGSWHTITRDIAADLFAGAELNLEYVKFFTLRGSYQIDDITLGEVQVPTADFTVNTTMGKSPLDVQFTDLSNSSHSGFSWDFGDGSTSDEQNPSHSFTEPGPYTVSLTITNSAGSDTKTKVNYITVFSNDYETIEDAEDGGTAGWITYTGGGVVSNIYDDDRGSRVIQLEGTGSYFNNGFKLTSADGSLWNNTKHLMTWSMNVSDNFKIYIWVETNLGKRYMYYTPAESGEGYNDWDGTVYIHHNLGEESMESGWKTYTRNLQADLTKYDPDATIWKVQAFLIRGKGLIDDIGLDYKAPETEVVVEDAEDGGIAGWVMYTDGGQASDHIHNEFDTDRGSRIINLAGPNGSTGDGFKLTNPDGSLWNNSNRQISWSMNFSSNFVIYIWVSTNQGKRYLYYVPEDADEGYFNYGGTGYIGRGLGVDAKDGQWHTFARDLQADLSRFESDVSIINVEAFLLRGAGKIDDIKLNYIAPPSNASRVILEDAEDGTKSGWSIYSGTGNAADHILNMPADEQHGSRFVRLMGPAGNSEDGFIFSQEGTDLWSFSCKSIEWSMKFSSDYVFYVGIKTSDGSNKYIYYTSEDFDRGLVNWDGVDYIHQGLGYYDGTWTTFSRDLLTDLNEYFPGVTITSVRKICVRGAGDLDDIILEYESTSGKPEEVSLAVNSVTQGQDINLKDLADPYSLRLDTGNDKPALYNPYTDGDQVKSQPGEGLVKTPQKFELLGNYPNPFNPETSIRFSLPASEFVDLKIYSSTGRLVKTLIFKEMPAGFHNFIWNGKNENGTKVGSGIYIYRIKAGKYTAVRKMALLK